MNRSFKGVWFPKEIWTNQELSFLQKGLLIEIESLDNESGCFATNTYFAKFFQASERWIVSNLKALEDMGYISRKYKKKEGGKPKETQRIIRVTRKYYQIFEQKPEHENTSTPHELEITPPMNSSSPPPRTLVHPPHEQSFTHNNTVNNTINNTSESVAHTHEEEILKSFSDPLPSQPLLKKEKGSGQKEKDLTDIIVEKIVSAGYKVKDNWKIKYQADVTAIPGQAKDFAEWWISKQDGCTDATLKSLINQTSAKVFQLKFSGSWLKNAKKFAGGKSYRYQKPEEKVMAALNARYTNTKNLW